MPVKSLPPSPSLDHLKYQAKDLQHACRSGHPEALARIKEFHPKFRQKNEIGTTRFSIADAQLVIAREYGFETWPKLKRHIESLKPLTTEGPNLKQFERIAQDLLKAYRTGETRAMQTVWTHFGHRRTWEVMRRYVLLDLGRGSEKTEMDISLVDAQLLVARGHGFESWESLVEYLARLPEGRVMIAGKPVKVFSIDNEGGRQTVARVREWETVLKMMQEGHACGLDAEGQMTDALLERISGLDQITSLDLNGSNQLTDTGVQFLANMPQLERLDLSGTGITDGGLEVLRHLKKLKTIKLSWTAITDAGATHLSNCDGLERVDLSATHTGDGAIKALTGKQKLRFVMSGANVTNDGIALLHEFPVFKTWQGGEASMALLDYEAGPNYLGLRGPFDNTGLAKLAGLEGLFALNVDDRKLAVSAAGLAPIVTLPNLGWLAFDAKDDAMPYIASMPKLRFLMCQDTVAEDDGFVALSRSQSIEYIWGRRCHNLRARGFTALPAMPSLRGLSVSCKNVDDEGLSALPRFPALRELMPMDVPDEGYCHVGRCEKLESLVLMYCRDTSDAATEHIGGLSRLKKYFASYTKITDRSMEILSGILSLEEISFYGCPAVTNAGVVMLARLPRLQELAATGPKITSACAAAFPPRVKTRFSE
jgi:Leucine-rich repeat (LRR) protein